MIELNGKNGTAKVFTDNIDSITISQVIELLNQEFIGGSRIRIMPDCHAGKGCVVGTTMTLSDKVVPNLVGVDIGCGMLATKLEEDHIDMAHLDEVINEFIPSGFDINSEAITSFSELENFECEVDQTRANRSIGTLGGGNHFIEVDKDKNGAIWLVIHCGSRHLGIEVCEYYQSAAHESLKGASPSKIEDIIANLKKQGRESEIQRTIEEARNREIAIPKYLAYVEGSLFDGYIHDMNLAQKFAKLNRKTIADVIVDKMNLHRVESFDTIHNYIDIENMILRKGSISAQLGEKVIIPMNMRDGSLICTGKGNSDWNFSAPHGAGRIMSRAQAKKNVDFEDFKNSMEGIYSTSVVESTVDESPMVYKPIEEIMNNVKETVDIDDVIKPVYNYKAH